MGEIADMMLDGTLCEGCGEYLGYEDGDYPRLCDSCAKIRKKQGHDVQNYGHGWVDGGVKEQATCNICNKTLKSAQGLAQHMADKHMTV